MKVWLTMLATGLHAYGTIYFSMLLVALIMPEEPALLAWGLAVGTWQLHPVPAFLAAVLGVLTTDLGLYMLGRFGGRQLLQRLGWRFWFSPQRQQAIQHGFHKSGALWLITARLLPIPGLRTGVFVSAGMLHYPWWRFVVCDAVFLGMVGGALVVGGYYCADAMSQWLREFDALRYWLTIALMLVAGVGTIWWVSNWLGRQLSRRTLDTTHRQRLELPDTEMVENPEPPSALQFPPDGMPDGSKPMHESSRPADKLCLREKPLTERVG
ncbi:hypothetical protein HRbin36_01051 [bacterium HR36]|nr:hypothetical protein HRbin36_01051 [bacterium HR36]